MGGLRARLAGRLRMVREDALAVSRVVEGAFRGESELDDERLDPHLRQVFYDLQDEKLLDVRRVEVRDERGAIRRHYLWSIRDGDALPDLPATLPSGPAERLYARLPEESWGRRPATGDAPHW